jgi:hypothetical protein
MSSKATGNIKSLNIVLSITWTYGCLRVTTPSKDLGNGLVVMRGNYLEGVCARLCIVRGPSAARSRLGAVTLRGCRCCCLSGVGYAVLAVGQVILLIPLSFHTTYILGLIYLYIYC